MLAWTGMIAQEAVCLPQFSNGATPIDDFFVVPAAGLWQVFFAIGAVEFSTNAFKLTPGDMFSVGREAGDFGFAPWALERILLPSPDAALLRSRMAVSP